MKALRVVAALSLAVFAAGHVGSPTVFYSGKVGSLDLTVAVQPPVVVPGIARVMLRAPAYVTSATIRPVYWRAATKGAPSADAMRVTERPREGWGKVLEGRPMKTFEGQVWLMSRGAYSVHVGVRSPTESGTLVVPVPAVPTGRLALDTPLAGLLVVLGLFLVTGLVNIVRKGAGEGLLEPGKQLDDAGARRTRIAGISALVVLALVAFGGARWWDAVDGDYQRTIYRPAPLAVTLTDGELHVVATESRYGLIGQPSGFLPDHGKPMHLFLVSGRAMAHLHPRQDSGSLRAFSTALPALPAGAYNVYADVVEETGFERTMVGSVEIPDKTPGRLAKLDPDDGWFVGRATASKSVKLADGTTMTFAVDSATPVAGRLLSMQVSLTDAQSRPVLVEQYLGMPAHAVVVRDSGDVFVHLHPSGTATMAAIDAFAARDRGDTTANGRLNPMAHDMAAMRNWTPVSKASFPYAFPKAGAYRVFVQVKRGGRVLTGAFAVNVDAAPVSK